MNPASPFQIGDEVEIIGPARGPIYLDKNSGKIHAIEEDSDGSIGYCVYGYWYPASSLRKVEELQIGDYVEVIGSAAYFKQCAEKKIFRITKMPDECRDILGLGGIAGAGDYYSGEGLPMYPASSLRKLTPEEIPSRIICRLPTCDLADKFDERLSAIEKRQAEIEEYLDGHRQSHEKWRDRTLAIEKWQMEHDLERTSRFRETPNAGGETLDAMIADGTLEVSDFRKKDIQSRRRIIRQLEEELADGCDGAICEECEEAADSYVDLSTDDREEALSHAIRWLRMPDMRRDPQQSHEVADVLEGMLEEVK